MKDIKTIDLEKRKIENQYILKYYSIFSKIQKDISKAILKGREYNINEIVNKYYSDLNKIITDNMNKSIDNFGYGIRAELKKVDGIDFNNK